jgi:hypothetical protein
MEEPIERVLQVGEHSIGQHGDRRERATIESG